MCLAPSSAGSEDKELLLSEVHRAEPWAGHTSKACSLCGGSQAGQPTGPLNVSVSQKH